MKRKPTLKDFADEEEQEARDEEEETGKDMPAHRGIKLILHLQNKNTRDQEARASKAADYLKRNKK